MRRVIFYVLVIVLIWFFLVRFNDLETLMHTLASGDRWYILAAGLAVLVYFVVFSASYYAALRSVGIFSRIRSLLPTTLASLAVNIAAPTAGLGGGALWVDLSAREQRSAPRATVGIFLQLALDYLALCLLVIPSLVFLYMHHDLALFEALTAAGLLILTTMLVVSLLLGLFRPAYLENLLATFQRLINRLGASLKRPGLLYDDWSDQVYREFENAALAIKQAPLWALATLLVALAAHFFNILALYLLFQAFGGKITWEPLVVGYVIGILFWVISITPQGVGVVEGVMSLVFTSLGSPPEIATTVTFAFRGLTLYLPVLAGLLVLRQVGLFGSRGRAATESWQVHLAAVLTAGLGVLNVVSAILPRQAPGLAWLEAISPLRVAHGGRLASVVSGYFLLILAYNLWRRKHRAWLLAVIVLLISGFGHILKGASWLEAGLSFGLALWLVFLRPYFHARSDPPSLRYATQVLIASLVFTLLYGITGFYLLDRQFNINFDLFKAVRQTFGMFVGMADPGIFPVTRLGRFFVNSIYLTAIITITSALLLFLRPVIQRKIPHANELERAKQIVELYGHTSLAQMQLLPDKTYYFSPGSSVVAYTVRNAIAIALGDPVGPPQDLPITIDRFNQFCTHNSWTPVYYQTQEDTLSIYRQAGLFALCIGNEAVVDLSSFSLEGHAMKPLRTSRNRILRLGYTATVYAPPLDNNLLNALRAVSDEWLTIIRGSEKGFSLGWFDEELIRNYHAGVVRSPDGWITAFATILPEYQKSELVVDLMRHRQNIEPGTMDFLFINVLEWAQSQAYQSFNLGLSAFSGVGERSDDPALERAMHYIYTHNKLYNFQGLHEYKEKFGPGWSPRYLICPAISDLIPAWLAVTEANSGQARNLLDLLREILPRRVVAQPVPQNE
jgi:phosphatidylglycerol lysyltransferase